jgi:hypothetical protein
MNFENRLAQLERENADFRNRVARLEQVVDPGISDRSGGKLLLAELIAAQNYSEASPR